MKQDITDDYARWEALKTKAELDPLTGVANRLRFQRFLDQSDEDPAQGEVGALILFDLDEFKRLNAWWGHSAGDACLAAFGERLRNAFPEACMIARIGGGEFAVLVPLVSSSHEAEIAVRSRIGSLRNPVLWKGELLPLTVSISLAFVAQGEGLYPQGLFEAADNALYNAKRDASNFLVRL